MTIRHIIVDDTAGTAQDAKNSLLTEDAISGATTVTNAGKLENTGDLSVNTDKFTVDASSGDTAVAGDVAVGTDKFTVNASSGDTSIAGNLSINTNKFTVAGASGNTVIAGSLSVGGARFVDTTVVNTATYDLLSTDANLLVTYTSTGAVTSLTLPTAQAVAGREVTIIDAGNNASTNNIAIDTEGTEKISGNDSVTINTDSGTVTLISDGTNWFLK